MGVLVGGMAAVPILDLARRFLMTFLVEVLNTIPLVAGVEEGIVMDNKSEEGSVEEGGDVGGIFLVGTDGGAHAEVEVEVEIEMGASGVFVGGSSVAGGGGDGAIGATGCEGVDRKEKPLAGDGGAGVVDGSAACVPKALILVLEVLVGFARNENPLLATDVAAGVGSAGTLLTVLGIVSFIETLLLVADAMNEKPLDVAFPLLVLVLVEASTGSGSVCIVSSSFTTSTVSPSVALPSTSVLVFVFVFVFVVVPGRTGRGAGVKLL